MAIDALAEQVRHHFETQASRYGLQRSSVHVESRLNWGGFHNTHFEVGDGRVTYHLKLTHSPVRAARLQRWQRLGPLLVAKYRAPEIIDYVTLHGTPFQGLLFKKSAGQAAALASQPLLVHDIVALLHRLHADADLAQCLRAEGAGGNTRQSVLDCYVDRFETDLAESGARFPVSGEVLAFMQRETALLRRLIETDAAFEGAEAVPIHGDLWDANILVESGADWLVIDWDDLTLGDAVLDFAMLLWPLLRQGGELGSWLGSRAQDQAMVARLRLCLRACLLDEVIDSLADWVEAEAAPMDRDRVRTVKLETHQRALAEYRTRYDFRCALVASAGR
jgi:aminoglycoside phosphotransferase (APT) family kinase protein